MSVACTIRAVLLMTLMPDADSREVLTTLLGELTAVPWQRSHAVPSPTVLSTWRAAIGEAPLQQLQQELQSLWGPAGRTHHVRWPLVLRVGRKPRETAPPPSA